MGEFGRDLRPVAVVVGHLVGGQGRVDGLVLQRGEADEQGLAGLGVDEGVIDAPVPEEFEEEGGVDDRRGRSVGHLAVETEHRVGGVVELGVLVDHARGGEDVVGRVEDAVGAGLADAAAIGAAGGLGVAGGAGDGVVGAELFFVEQDLAQDALVFGQRVADGEGHVGQQRASGTGGAEHGHAERGGGRDAGDREERSEG